VTKFVGKFRKNKNYNDDYNYDKKRHRNEHSESKKQLQRKSEDWYVDNDTKFSPVEKY
jgi:hypothetical protein